MLLSDESRHIFFPVLAAGVHSPVRVEYLIGAPLFPVTRLQRKPFY